MTRRLPGEGMEDVLTLAKLKELAAMERVAVCRSVLEAQEIRIAQLRAREFSVETPDLARQLDKWMSWRQQELRALYTEAAKLKAELLEAAAVLGRARTEHEVARKVAQKTRLQQKRVLEQRASYIS